MVQRNTPCTECRKHRRKCIRDSVDETCSRCKRLERNCITYDLTDEYSSNSENAEKFIDEIEHLNYTIADLENQINQLKISNNNHNSNSSISSISSIISSISSSISSNSNISSISSSNSSSVSSSSVVDINDTDSKGDNDNKNIVQYKNNQTQTGDWTLTIQNGTMHIETGIKNISDLLSHCPPIQYLSPFQTPTEQGIILQFSGKRTMCLRVLASKMLKRSLDPDRESNNSVSLPFLSLPTSLLFDTRSMTDQLLDVFFQCHNTFHPLIHQKSFMAYYKQLENPLDSLLCLCICSYVCGSPCEHHLHNLGDFSDIGKYFAGLAKAKLMDQFDIKEKRIENMISINMLVSYFNSLLLNGECRKLLTISYQIAMDLMPWYEKECEKDTPSVEAVVYSRNLSSPLLAFQRSMKFPPNNKSIAYKMACLPWKSLPDEPVELVSYVNAQNLLIQLYNHPIMLKLKSHTQDLFFGHDCTIPFEMIIRLDEVVNEWWESLPECYRICDDWLSLDKCNEIVNECTNGLGLIVFVNFLIFMLGIYSQMLQPKYVTDDTVLSIVERMMLERALHCCQTVLHVFDRIKWIDTHSPCRYIIAMKRYLFHIADVLITLSSSSNQTIKEEAKSMYGLCINAIESMPFMIQHKVDPSTSPLLNKSHVSLEDLEDINLSVYSSYPQPWYALICDMCHYLSPNSQTQDTMI